MTSEKEGDPDCSHAWIYSTWAVLTDPLIFHKICGKCGRVEHDSEPTDVRLSFEMVYEVFHGNESKK